MQLESASQHERGHGGPKQRGSFQAPRCKEGPSRDEPLWVPSVCSWAFCTTPDSACIRSGLCCACQVASVPSDSFRPYGLQPAGSSVHGILRARTLEWVAMPSSKGSSRPRDRTYTSYVSWGRQGVYHKCHLGSPHSTLLFPISCGGIQLLAHLESSQSS